MQLGLVNEDKKPDKAIKNDVEKRRSEQAK